MVMMILKIPEVGFRNSVSIPHITTVEIKCGAYDTVWNVFRKCPFDTSFRSKARMIGRVNPRIRDRRLNVSVFFRIIGNQ